MFRQPFHWALVFCLGASACASNPAPGASEPAAPDPSSQPAVASAAAESAEAASPEVAAATSAAQSWLALVDSGQYDESWKASAELFRSKISAETWAQAVGGVRAPLGKVDSRKVSAAELQTSLPGAPDGKYVVIQFSTAYEHKASAVETVTPMQEADGTWRVAGYFVK